MADDEEQITASDEELVKLAQTGSNTAFDQLVLRHQSQAVSIAQGLLHDFDLSKDVAQNAFVKAYVNIKKFRGDARFKTWLIRIVLNEAKSIRRKEKIRNLIPFFGTRESDSGESEFTLEVIPSTDRSAAERAQAHELKDRVEQLVGQLPPREREVFVLRYLEELSLAEVAVALNVSVGTVKAHSSHAMQKFKMILMKEGVQNG